MIRALATGLTLLGVVTTGMAAPPTGTSAPVSSSISPTKTVAPVAAVQSTALPISTPTGTLMPDPQFKVNVPIRLIGMPRNADVATVKCRVDLGGAGGPAGSASGQVDTPIPPPADTLPITLRQLITNVMVPVALPASTTAAALAGQASFTCELSVKQGLDAQHQIVLAPVYTSSNGPAEANFPLAPGQAFVLRESGNFF